MSSTAPRERAHAALSVVSLGLGLSLGLCAVASPSHAQSPQILLWDNPNDGNTTAEDSIVYDAFTIDREVADDFDVEGTIERVAIAGNGCTFGCDPSSFLEGVFVRFWSATPEGPGALQHESYLAADDPRFVYGSTSFNGLEITLPEAFEATGEHFLSVQVELNSSFTWRPWRSNQNAPRGQSIHYRDAEDGMGGVWGPHRDFDGSISSADVAFSLYGRNGEQPPSSVVADCGRWQQIPAPEPDGALSSRLHGVSAEEDGTLWAVGTHAQQADLGSSVALTLAMVWNGDAWQIVDTPSPGIDGCTVCTQAILHAVDVVPGESEDHVWAAGFANLTNQSGFVGPQILVLRGDETGFEALDTPLAESCSGTIVRAVKAWSNDDVWFVGDRCGPVPNGGVVDPALALHWDGSSFDDVTLPFEANNTSGAHGLQAIDGVAPDDMWAVGGSNGGGLSIYSYILRWDGSSWTRVEYEYPGTPGVLPNLHVVASDDVWISGAYFDGEDFQPLILHWNGTSLEEVPPPPAPGGGGEFMGFAPDRILQTGTDFILWNGSEWIDQPELFGHPDVTLTDLEATGACDGWGVGWDRSGGGGGNTSRGRGEQGVGTDRLVTFRVVETPLLFEDDFESGTTGAWQVP